MPSIPELKAELKLLDPTAKTKWLKEDLFKVVIALKKAKSKGIELKAKDVPLTSSKEKAEKKEKKSNDEKKLKAELKETARLRKEEIRITKELKEAKIKKKADKKKRTSDYVKKQANKVIEQIKTNSENKPNPAKMIQKVKAGMAKSKVIAQLNRYSESNNKIIKVKKSIAAMKNDIILNNVYQEELALKKKKARNEDIKNEEANDQFEIMESALEDTIVKIREAQEKYIKYYKVYIKSVKYAGVDSKKLYSSKLKKYVTGSKAHTVDMKKYTVRENLKHIKRENQLLELLLRTENLNILSALFKYAIKLKQHPLAIKYLHTDTTSMYQLFFKPLRKALTNKKYIETAKLASKLNLNVQEKVPLNILQILPEDAVFKGTHHLEGGRRWYNEIGTIYDRNENELRTFQGTEIEPKVKFSKSFFPNDKVYHSKTNKKRAEE